MPREPLPTSDHVLDSQRAPRWRCYPVDAARCRRRGGSRRVARPPRRPSGAGAHQGSPCGPRNRLRDDRSHYGSTRGSPRPSHRSRQQRRTGSDPRQRTSAAGRGCHSSHRARQTRMGDGSRRRDGCRGHPQPRRARTARQPRFPRSARQLLRPDGGPVLRWPGRRDRQRDP